MIGPGGFGQAPNTGVGRGSSATDLDGHDSSMNKHDRQEHIKLQRAWVDGTATKKQILRCMELDRSAAHQHNINH
jgi:hypothetical protein